LAIFLADTRQSTGKADLSTSGSSDLWLENGAGVIMHLQGASSGAMLTLGKDELDSDGSVIDGRGADVKVAVP